MGAKQACKLVGGRCLPRGRSVRGWSVDVPDGCSRSSAGKRLAEVVGKCRDDVGLHRPMRQAPIPVTVGPTAEVAAPD